jgi:hypothetical protein
MTMVYSVDGLLNSNNCESAYLVNQRIGDAESKKIADWLTQNRTLTILILCNNHIGDDGASRFADALRSNTTLTFLVMLNNQITSIGASRFVDALQTNITLTDFYFDRNDISESLIETIDEMLLSNMKAQIQIKKETILLVGWCLKSRKIPVDVVTQMKSFYKLGRYRHVEKVGVVPNDTIKKRKLNDGT